MSGAMLAVELPQELRGAATQQDLDAVRALKQQHERELQEYEEQTRRLRKNLRALRKTLSDKKAAEVSQEGAEMSETVAESAAETQSTEATAEAEKAAERQAEAERLETEAFLRKKAELEEELAKLRAERERAQAWAEERAADDDGSDQGESDNSEWELGRPPRAAAASTVARAAVSGVQGLPASASATSFHTAEELPSAAPSAVPSTSPSMAPSAASSAAPSRSTSPSGSDAAGRCAQLPATAVAVAVEAFAVTPGGKGSASTAVAVAEPVNSGGAAPTPRKGKGKGKAPGAAPLATPRPGAKQEKPAAKPSKFASLFWKATQKPEEVDFTSDPFLEKLQDLGPRDVPFDRSTLDVPAKIEVPAWPATIFSAGVTVQTIPEEMLEAYFKKSEVAVKLPQVDNSKHNKGVAGRSSPLLDQKKLHMIGVMLQKHIMKHKEESNREAILNIKRGVLQCNFEVVKLECLSVIRTVLRQHVKDGNPLCTYVQEHGEGALWQLAYPEHHFLVYELSKVPQIDERLECMLFQLGFVENLNTSRRDLETLMKALEALNAKRDLIRRFFVTAHRLGQSLSQKPSRGFQLSTLEKLTLTKSTKMPHLSILHFVLALMSPEDAQELFTEGDIVLLRNAKALGTAKVGDDVRELAQGLYGVKQIYESGEYTCQSTGQAVKIERRRKTLPPCAAAAALAGEHREPVIDTDDHFHEVMQKFVDTHVDEADDVVVECHKMLLLYKELALFFDDLNNVYPPPKDGDASKKLDLVDVFYRFAKEVPRHRQQVEDECLRRLLASTSS